MSEQADWTTSQRAATAAALATAESPAEAVLLVHLLAARDGDTYAVGGPGCSWRLSTQREVVVERATYRLDIALERGPHRVCVEIDGWAYHHATEAQEARDAARDLALRMTGWTVIRLPASRVFAAPSDVVDGLVAQLADIERIGVPKPIPPSPNADIIDRLRRGGNTPGEEDALLREVFSRTRERLGIDKEVA